MQFAGLGKNVLQIKQSPKNLLRTLYCLLHPQNVRVFIAAVNQAYGLPFFSLFLGIIFVTLEIWKVYA